MTVSSVGISINKDKDSEDGNRMLDLTLLITKLVLFVLSGNLWNKNELLRFFEIPEIQQRLLKYTKLGILTPPGIKPDNSSGDEHEEIRHWCKWAFAAYKEKIEDVYGELMCDGIIVNREEDEFYLEKSSKAKKRCHFMALNHKKKKLVISIRGTHAFNDVLADLKFKLRRFKCLKISGYAHSGFKASADWIFKQRVSRIKDLLKAHKDYGLVVTGHSLGGATALILSLKLKEFFSQREVECWTFGCPPCVTADFLDVADHVRNVVYGHDFIARICIRNARLIGHESKDERYFEELKCLSMQEPIDLEGIKSVMEERKKEFDYRKKFPIVPGFLYHFIEEIHLSDGRVKDLEAYKRSVKTFDDRFFSMAKKIIMEWPKDFNEFKHIKNGLKTKINRKIRECGETLRNELMYLDEENIDGDFDYESSYEDIDDEDFYKEACKILGVAATAPAYNAASDGIEEAIEAGINSSETMVCTLYKSTHKCSGLEKIVFGSEMVDHHSKYRSLIKSINP